MSNETDYTLEDLMEQARNDDSWEPDPKKREEITKAFAVALA